MDVPVPQGVRISRHGQVVCQVPALPGVVGGGQRGGDLRGRSPCRAGEVLRVKELDPVIHAPTRLRLLGIANTLAEIEFSSLRDRLEVSDSVLSKHLAALAAEGYIALRKSKVA